MEPSGNCMAVFGDMALSLADSWTGFHLCMHVGKVVSAGPEEDTCCHLIQGIPGTYILSIGSAYILNHILLYLCMPYSMPHGFLT